MFLVGSRRGDLIYGGSVAGGHVTKHARQRQLALPRAIPSHSHPLKFTARLWALQIMHD